MEPEVISLMKEIVIAVTQNRESEKNSVFGVFEIINTLNGHYYGNKVRITHSDFMRAITSRYQCSLIFEYYKADDYDVYYRVIGNQESALEKISSIPIKKPFNKKEHIYNCSDVGMTEFNRLMQTMEGQIRRHQLLLSKSEVIRKNTTDIKQQISALSSPTSMSQHIQHNKDTLSRLNS